jgi:gamma-glutamylcyclotransferase (GGCT)/AIG2-like uncharacterized protein YtfP
MANDSFKYFAYGSNMSPERLKCRTKSAKMVCMAWLPGYKLAFHKVSDDKSAKADCFETENPDDLIYGGIFEILKSQEAALDLAEGYPKGYGKRSVDVHTEAGLTTVSTYIAKVISRDNDILPYDWYMQHVLIGAEAFKLPAEYTEVIKNYPSKKDHDQERVQNQMRCYSGKWLGVP